MSLSSTMQRSPSSPRRTKNATNSHVSTMTSKTSRDSMSSSCPEFRTGYRIQRQAYERRAQTPTLMSIIRNRQARNEYVDLLKSFYRLDTEDQREDHSHRLSLPKNISSSRNTLKDHPAPKAKLQSSIRLPEMTPRPATSRDAKSSLRLQSQENYFAPSHVTKIPPPIPFQLINTNAPLRHRGISSASSLSPDLTASILEAVNSSSVSSSKRKTSKVNPNRRRLQAQKIDHDPRRLAMKVSMPCRIGCCYCVYSSILGPVKVFLTKGQKPKQGPWLTGIRDGYGRLSIPVSRKHDVSGLVYNAHSYSLHPPAKGQRPLFPFHKSHHVAKTKIKEREEINTNKRKQQNSSHITL